MKYRKIVPVEASQWFKNGDHPLDASYDLVDSHDQPFLSEGKIVRRFRRPDVPGAKVCEHCGNVMDDHGWIDTIEGEHGAQIVCPGDFIITGVKGEFYPCKPDIFAATYERA